MSPKVNGREFLFSLQVMMGCAVWYALWNVQYNVCSTTRSSYMCEIMVYGKRSVAE